MPTSQRGARQFSCRSGLAIRATIALRGAAGQKVRSVHKQPDVRCITGTNDKQASGEIVSRESCAVCRTIWEDIILLCTQKKVFQPCWTICARIAASSRIVARKRWSDNCWGWLQAAQDSRRVCMNGVELRLIALQETIRLVPHIDHHSWHV